MPAASLSLALPWYCVGLPVPGIASPDPRFIRHHQFKVADLAPDHDFLERAGSFRGFREKLQEVLIRKMVV